MVKEVCLDGRIWDLHIHSCSCTSVSVAKKPTVYAVKDYIDSLLKVFEKNNRIDMISFTDHNEFNADVYKEFYSRGCGVVLLPGVEVDVSLEEDSEQSKHLLIYFDAVGDNGKFDSLVNNFNKIMEDCKVSPSKPIYIASLLDKLVSLPNSVRFALSPHALKQGKRGFDSGWHCLSREDQIAQIDMHKDQFFCFWEAGRSSIARAIEYLKGIYNESNQSIVSFSDSKSIEDFKKYVDDPPNYFHALPNFNGLVMTGSEILRITSQPDSVAEENFGQYLGSVFIGDQVVRLSPRMNAVIGGRGAGKSVLLDSIALSLGEGKSLHNSRKKYLHSRNLIIQDMNEMTVVSNFKIDYFSQNYVSKLFEKNGDAFNKELEQYFHEGFSKVEPIDKAASVSDLKSVFSEYFIEGQAKVASENIAGFVEKFVYEENDLLNLNIRKTDIDDTDESLSDYSYKVVSNDLASVIDKKVPKFLKTNKEIQRSARALLQTVCVEANKKRCDYIGRIEFKNYVVESFLQKKTQISETQKRRVDAIEVFQKNLTACMDGYSKRVKLINAYIFTAEKLREKYELNSDGSFERKKRAYANGAQSDAFEFSRVLEIEHPFEHLITSFQNAMNLINRKVGTCGRSNLWEYVEAFCYNTAEYSAGKTAEDTCQSLSRFNLFATEESRISYREEESTAYLNIAELSPGMQTNILLEYIVYKDTSIPLLIDQPEDNVDNRTIYNNIRCWFRLLKQKRQIVVVTHDANIVINADTENVIVATHLGQDQFQYTNGALEYKDTIDVASEVLDGGKQAVKRRLIKYGG